MPSETERCLTSNPTCNGIIQPLKYPCGGGSQTDSAIQRWTTQPLKSLRGLATIQEVGDETF